MVSLSFFNDDPAGGATGAPDVLRRERYVEHAVRMLRRVRQQSDSGVLALIGPWGAGKSTVLGMITGLLEQPGSEEQWLVADLNPWMYTDLDSLTAALFAEIRQCLPSDKRWRETRQQLAAFGKTISPLGTLGMLAGVNGQSILEKLAERVGGDTSASAAKRKVETALRRLNQPILVVMDDLDRLTPAELLLVFKLVRLVGRLPHVHYLLSYDERTLRDVLLRTDLVGNHEARAGEFLEKMVQVRLDLPAFREQDANALIEQGLEAVLGAYGRSMEAGDLPRFVEAFLAHLQERLTTPRAIKRFFAQVDAGLHSVADEVDIVDYLLVTFLRTMEPSVFSMIKRYRADLTGTSMRLLLPRRRPEENLELWHERLAATGVAEEHREGVLRVLAVMFKPVSDALGRGGGSSADADQRRGIGSNDYFDRYTLFSLPEDDQSEADFDAALGQLASGQTGPEYTVFLERLRDDTQRVVRRMRNRLGTLPAPQALALLADEIGSASSRPEGILGLFTGQRVIEHFAYPLFALVPDDARESVLERMARTADGSILAVRCLHHVVRPEENSRYSVLGTLTLPPWAAAARGVLADKLRDHLQPAATRPADQLDDVQRSLLRLWNAVAPEQARTWTQAVLSAGDWNLLSLLVRLSPPDVVQSDKVTADLIELDALVGLDYIRAHLAAHISAAPTAPAPEATNSERVLGALHRHQDEPAQ